MVKYRFMTTRQIIRRLENLRHYYSTLKGVNNARIDKMVCKLNNALAYLRQNINKEIGLEELYKKFKINLW